MQAALKLTARVLPGKRVEFTAPELTEGEDVELIVLKSDKSIPPPAQPFASAWEYLQSLKPVERTPEEWEAVERELQAEKTPPRVRQWIANPPSWLEVREIIVPPDPALAELDPGEREAIALAEALRADALILDEKSGRREAERRKLRVIGTVRVLDDAAEADLVDLPAALERLQALGFYLDKKLMQLLLERHSARRQRKREP